jgi:SOS-response transcriptional repressor LexA
MVDAVICQGSTFLIRPSGTIDLGRALAAKNNGTAAALRSENTD